MDAISATTERMTQVVGGWAATAVPSPKAGSGDSTEMRDRLGEFVGNVFYGTLIRQMQSSKLKGPFLHGGRGEDVFQGQLGMELAKRLGRAPNDPVTNHLYEAMTKRGSGGTGVEQGKVREGIRALAAAESGGKP